MHGNGSRGCLERTTRQPLVSSTGSQWCRRGDRLRHLCQGGHGRLNHDVPAGGARLPAGACHGQGDVEDAGCFNPLRVMVCKRPMCRAVCGSVGARKIALEIQRMRKKPACRSQGYWVFRYSRTAIAAPAPSPTADATCLMLPWRTSPAAKTPGALVSKAKARRPSLILSVWLKSRPVRI